MKNKNVLELYWRDTMKKIEMCIRDRYKTEKRPEIEI